MAITTVQETDEDMRRAWRILRRPCWPQTFEDTMHDPLRAQLVQMYAHHLALAAAVPDCPATARFTPRVPDRRTPPATPTLFRPPPTVVDRKRAAAGDRDD